MDLQSKECSGVNIVTELGSIYAGYLTTYIRYLPVTFPRKSAFLCRIKISSLLACVGTVLNLLLLMNVLACTQVSFGTN